MMRFSSCMMIDEWWPLPARAFNINSTVSPSRTQLSSSFISPSPPPSLPPHKLALTRCTTCYSLLLLLYCYWKKKRDYDDDCYDDFVMIIMVYYINLRLFICFALFFFVLLGPNESGSLVKSCEKVVNSE